MIKLGYQVDCFDGFTQELFDNNAKKYGVEVQCQPALWQDLPEALADKQYDFIFCRGNSYIYAGGGWDEVRDVDQAKIMTDYQKTMDIFAGIMADGGYMYIDKFKDDELGHKEKLATIKVGAEPQDLVFSSRRFSALKNRQAIMELIAHDTVVQKEVRVTYDLSEAELMQLAVNSGLKIERIEVTEEKHFDVWLARK